MRIAVVGDVLLDVDLTGSADRLSPDAPVPVVSVSDSVERAGGAGLVAALLARDGVDVTLVTVLGDDSGGERLRRAIERSAGGPGAGRIDVVAGPSGAPTPVKTRVRGSGQAVVRIDEGCDPPGPAHATPAMLAALGVTDATAPASGLDLLDAMVAATGPSGLDAVDAVVVADYGRGVVADPALRDALERLGRRVPLVWDPHPKGETPIAAAAVVTPNAGEALAAAGVRAGSGGPGPSGISAAGDAAAELAGRWGCGAVLVTLGHRGALLHVPAENPEVPHVVPAVEVADVDPCGAGDRLAATLAVRLAAGDRLPAAVAAAVASAGRFLADGGVAALARPDNARPLGGEADDALAVAHRTRAAGGTVIATGGCFDLLHAGHARTLAAARALGDCLIVCLNSDDSVRRLKGAERPIMPQNDRIDLLLALECVDAVIVFDEDTPETVLRRIEPEIWVKGGDYVADELPETAVLAEWGGRTVTVPFVPGRSSTRLAGALARVG